MATRGKLCPVRAGLASGRITEVHRPTAAEITQDMVDEELAAIRYDYPRLTRFVMRAYVAPLPIPGYVRYAFHSPFATIMVAAGLAHFDVRMFMSEGFRHVAEQVRRFRRPSRIGLASPRACGCTSWDQVERCREYEGPELTFDQRLTLALQAGACPRCGAADDDLAWVYYESPAATWTEKCGVAGWLAVCDPCQERVALFIDQQN